MELFYILAGALVITFISMSPFLIRWLREKAGNKDE